jgi:hypothetical protein
LDPTIETRIEIQSIAIATAETTKSEADEPASLDQRSTPDNSPGNLPQAGAETTRSTTADLSAET